MTERIDIIKPNLFLIEGTYNMNGGEVYFSLHLHVGALKNASIRVDSVISETVGQLKVGKSSGIFSKYEGPDTSDLPRNFVKEMLISEYGNFQLPLKKYLEGTPIKGLKREAEQDKSTKRVRPVFWDANLDPREFFYARTNPPEDTTIYRNLVITLKDFDKVIANHEAGFVGNLVIDKNATREAMRKGVEEISAHVGEREAIFHVIRGERFWGKNAVDYPVARISIAPVKTDDQESVRRIMNALAENLKEFDGPALSVDHVPKFMHSIKYAEPTVEHMSRCHGGHIKVTSVYENWRRLLFQDPNIEL